MYYKYVLDNDIQYSLYLLTLLRLLVLKDKSEYDKLNMLFGIPKTELDYFLKSGAYMMPLKNNFLKRIKKDVSLKNQRYGFEESIEFINMIIMEYTSEDRNFILRKIIHIIYRDISSDYAAGIFYKKHPTKKRPGLVPFPIYDENHKQLIASDFISPKQSTLDLSLDDVIINPLWRRESVKNCIDYLQCKTWKYSQTNHLGYKYSVINIGYVYNGLHSAAFGQIYKQGIIENVKIIARRSCINIFILMV